MGEAELRQQAAARFESEFGVEPAWTGSAPGRVNLIGEHVDYVGGLVLPAAIDLFVALAGGPADHWRAVSPQGDPLPYLQALAEELGTGPQRVVIAADLPPGKGLSSSAALLVAAAAGLMPAMGGREAALACQRAERAAGVEVGIMDHFAAALGRAGHAILLDCASLQHRYVAFPQELLIAVLDSGVTRRLADTSYAQRRRSAKAAVEAAGGVLQEVREAGPDPIRRHLVTEVARVRSFATALEHGDLGTLGRLLTESHQSLRDDFQVSTPELDRLVEQAASAPGCLGARLMGAGFGGSALALCRAGSERDLRARVAAPVTFCRTSDGAFVRGRAA